MNYALLGILTYNSRWYRYAQIGGCYFEEEITKHEAENLLWAYGLKPSDVRDDSVYSHTLAKGTVEKVKK